MASHYQNLLIAFVAALRLWLVLSPHGRGQLIVTDWDGDVTSDTYGEPVYFQFDEQAVGDWNGGGHNSVRIHRDRIIIFF